MTINEIKELAQKLKDADVEKIKAEIKSKESILKNNDLDEEELGEVLNTLFSILVIEQAFEDEVEGIEDMRAELEQELMESYEKYDKHMAKYKKEKKEEKKKKRRWLLDFFALSEDIRNKKETLGDSKKLISKMQNQINELKQQSSNENLEKACDHKHGEPFRDGMKEKCEECGNNLHEHKRHRDDIIEQVSRDLDKHKHDHDRGPNPSINKTEHEPTRDTSSVDFGPPPTTTGRNNVGSEFSYVKEALNEKENINETNEENENVPEQEQISKKRA